MTFIPPEFKLFKMNTLNLDKKYSSLLGRYQIDGSQGGEGFSGVHQTTLDVLIARTNQVIRCKTDRETQRDVFNQLANELRQIPKEDEERIRQGTLFLLGALIHRYFRLIKEYDDFNAWTFWNTCSVTDCKLFQAIRIALQLQELDQVKKNFRTEDLKTLDVITIVRALEVFRDNMLLEDESKTPRYMKYPHFSKDEHFAQYLQDIIDMHTKRGRPFLLRFQAIVFIQSLAREIEREQQQIGKDLEKWCKGVGKEYKDFDVFKALERSVINASIIKSVESETSRNTIFNLFYTPLIQDGFETTDHTNLLAKMKECYDQTSSYILFGGYVLVLQQSKFLDPELLFALQQALGLERSLDELTKEDKGNGIHFLRQFLEIEPRTVLDYKFFGGRERMNTVIARAEKELATAVSQNVDSPVLIKGVA